VKTTLAVLLTVAAAPLALAVPASAGSRYPKPTPCGAGEPAYTGWNYRPQKITFLFSGPDQP
jgi:hypothetical protein